MLTSYSPQAWNATDRALAAVEDCEPRDQLAAGVMATVAVLGALRERFEKTPLEREAFDRLCSDTQAWVRREIEQLRFTKAH
ncbi:MAG TPA: hypothetical protein P5211_08320 [Anaerolineae bacterium]|nr:hypothetical protein [Anaerolineae bacterium]